MFKPIVKKNELKILNNGLGDTAVCILWTHMDKSDPILKKYQDKEIAVVGNLYSSNGIDDLFRNLYANPSIKTLIIDGLDLDKTKEELINSVKNGRLIEHKDGSIYLTPDHIELISDGHIIKKVTGNLDQLFLYPPEIVAEERPVVEDSGHSYKTDSLSELYYQLLNAVNLKGKVLSSRYGDTKELLNVSLSFKHSNKIEEFEGYAEDIYKGKIEETVAYTYGERLNKYYGLVFIIDNLVADPNSRDNYIPVFLPSDTKNSANYSPPCLTSVCFRIRNNKLYSFWTMRSNDVYNASQKNYYAFHYVTKKLAKELKTEIGEISVNVTSLHMYMRDQKRVTEFLEQNKQIPTEQTDSHGYFIINTEEEYIELIHKTVCGKVTKVIKGTDAETLGRQAREFIGNLDHAIWLGRMLKEAEIKLRGKNI